MKPQLRFGTALLMGLVVLGLGCGGTLKTGTAKKPANKPGEDGACPTERSLCGTGIFAICVDLQNDPSHCGTCDRACSPGIACQAGICQQTLCTGSTIPVSAQPPTAGSPAPGTNSSSYTAILLADINGDGHLDLVDWNPEDGLGNTFHVSLGLPGGGFATPDTYHSTSYLESISATDVNADGADDLLVFARADSGVLGIRVELWLGHTDGHLTLSSVTSVDGNASIIAVGDLSGDGWPDIVTAHSYASGYLSVYLSDSTGALHLSKTYTTGTDNGLSIRDWNGDGMPDIMVQGAWDVLYNRGDGTFEAAVSIAVSLDDGPTVVADFNGDGQTDFAVISATGQGLSQSARISVILGLGGSGFTPIRYYDVAGRTPETLRAADVNGDGQLDLIAMSMSQTAAAQPADYSLTVLFGNPDGTFQTPGSAISLGSNRVYDIAIGETTGDQRPDIVLAGANGQTTTLENTCQ
jgi:FG-GAP-like repeat/Stigma-specific protein, Stig1